MTIEDRLRGMVDAGACIQYPVYGGSVLSVAGIAWVVPGSEFRWCPMFPEDQHNIHFVSFDRYNDNGCSVMFFLKDVSVACISPYDDWPLFNVDEYLADRRTWLTMMTDPAKAEEFDYFLRTS